MTTAFQSEQYYTIEEIEMLFNSAFISELDKWVELAGAVDRHNIPLKIDGYTSPENGCYLCGKAMHYTELDNLAERGLSPDECLSCHHNGECPTCHGTGEVSTGRRLLSHDWNDAPEYDSCRCEDCNGCGDYDSYLEVNGVE